MVSTLRRHCWWVGGAIAFAIGCSQVPEAQLPAYRPGAASSRALAEFDQNHDGALDAAELAKAPGLAAAVATMDTNGDQKLSADEISTRIGAYLANRTGFMPLTLTILLGGQPLADAQVTLTPESFLADEIKPASGTTNADGLVAFQIEGCEFTGVNPGVYRIAVSKKDAPRNETLPATFNSATTLGIEVANDIPALERGATIDLK